MSPVYTGKPIVGGSCVECGGKLELHPVAKRWACGGCDGMFDHLVGLLIVAVLPQVPYPDRMRLCLAHDDLDLHPGDAQRWAHEWEHHWEGCSMVQFEALLEGGDYRLQTISNYTQSFGLAFRIDPRLGPVHRVHVHAIRDLNYAPIPDRRSAVEMRARMYSRLHLRYPTTYITDV